MKEAIKKFLDGGRDGRNILADTTVLEMGFDPKFVKRFTVTHKAGNGKYSLYDNKNMPVKSLNGVCELDFLYGIAREIGADTTAADNIMGRRSCAQALIESINKKVNDGTMEKNT